MAFSVSSLTDYINQESTKLLVRSFYENKSTQYYGTVQTGIKLTDAIQLLSVVAYPQADTSCSNTASGTTAFTQRNITVGAIKYHDTLCPLTLRTKWTQKLLRPGSNGEQQSLSFEQDIANNLVNLVKEHIETADWQGDTTSGDAVKRMYDGWIKIIDAAGTAIVGNTGNVTTGTGITSGASGNADTLINTTVDARTENIKNNSNQVFFIGTDWFDKYTTTLMAKNLFHTDATAWANYEMMIPGRNVKLVGVPGLSGTNRGFLGVDTNFVLGTDMENEYETFKMWYSEDDDNLKYTIRFKRGVQVAYPSEIVQFKLV